MNPSRKFELTAIGAVRREGASIRAEIDAPFRRGLKNLGQFSHVLVFWWADRLDTPDQRAEWITHPPYAPQTEMGVFATRSPYRPNPLAVTVCRIEAVDETAGVVHIQNIDAMDGTPIIDLKAYFPVSDRVRDAHIPAWLTGWPAWVPEEGLGS
jgi:tRNA (adenine37-N6)-methyltransferase